MKVALTNEIKFLDDKIKANQAQYDLGRKAAWIAYFPWRLTFYLKKNAMYFSNPFGITLIFTSNSSNSLKIKWLA